MISTSISEGESVYHRQAGGGGWGDPRERDPQAVARDVRNGKVLQDSARQEYGLNIDSAVDSGLPGSAKRPRTTRKGFNASA